MSDAQQDKNLKLIETELNFIARHVSNMRTDDYEAQHDIHLAVESALLALFEHKLSLEPACEETPEGVGEPDGYLVTTYEYHRAA